MSPKRCQNPQHWPWHMWKCLCVPNLYVAPGAAVMSCAGLSDWGWTRGLFWRWLRCLPSWPERRIDMCGKDSRWSVTNPRNFQVLLAVGWACFWHAQFLRPPLQRCKNAAQKRDCPKHSCKGCGEERLQRQLKGNMTPKQVNHLAGIKTCSQLLRNFSHALGWSWWFGSNDHPCGWKQPICTWTILWPNPIFGDKQCFWKLFREQSPLFSVARLRRIMINPVKQTQQLLSFPKINQMDLGTSIMNLFTRFMLDFFVLLASLGLMNSFLTCCFKDTFTLLLKPQQGFSATPVQSHGQFVPAAGLTSSDFAGFPWLHLSLEPQCTLFRPNFNRVFVSLLDSTWCSICVGSLLCSVQVFRW